MKRQIGLAFHGIGTAGRSLEPGEDRYWITRDAFYRCLDRVAALPNPSTVLLTFDDGNASDHDIALPALRDRGLTGFFFLITSRIDRIGSLSTHAIRALSDAGMTIGSHGIQHVDWRRLSSADLHAELHQSRSVLGKLTGRAVTSASFPFGRYDLHTIRAVQEAGYTRVFTTDGGTSVAGDFLLHRTNIRADTTEDAVARLLTGRESPAKRVVRSLKRLRRRFT